MFKLKNVFIYFIYFIVTFYYVTYGCKSKNIFKKNNNLSKKNNNICLYVKRNIMNKNNEIYINNNYNYINLNKKLLNKKFARVKDDQYYIINYHGEELEAEWEWVKKISIVYTWVDGSDINFQYLKSKYNGGINNTNNRYRSADELKYSIRSLEKYMPWHQGIIYIVTCNQIPKWLNINHSRIKIIYHKDIFPDHIFPTFDSNTIELFFDNIPGITEKFIYFNDDFFLNNYVHPCFFFTREGFYPKIYRNNNLLTITKRIFKKNISKKINIFNSMCYRTREIINKYLDENFQYNYLHHYPYVFYRDLIKPFRKYFNEEIKLLCIEKFRSWYKFQTIYLYQTFLEYIQSEKLKKFFINYKYNNNNIKLANYSCEIVPYNIGSIYIKYGVITDDFNENEKQFNFINNNSNILIYNFNDEYNKKKIFLNFIEFMMTKYPEPSSFEKSEYIELEKSFYSKLKIFKKKENFSYFNNTIISNNFINENQNILKYYNINIIEMYIKRKKELYKPLNKISDQEIEEINFLLNYKGEDLESKWKWAENISIVYIFENYKYENKKILISEINKLKYSLCSIEKYLLWFKGDIYIIIQNENKKIFSELNKNNIKIHLIDQNVITPKNTVNNFYNKYIVEMYLDNIPGLSERFIYLNHNHYFVNYIHPHFFFNTEFFPKYNFEIIKNDKNDVINNDSYQYTFKIIKNYFGDTYINDHRYLKNAPYPLYRDLFKPTRQVYKKYIDRDIKSNKYNKYFFLPLYMVITYNIYGTNQPYYPEYVGGYGKIRKIKKTELNVNRTIDFYGFDITSNNLSNISMITDISFNNKSKINEILKINKYKKEINKNLLFISIKEINTNYNNDLFFNFLNNLFK